MPHRSWKEKIRLRRLYTGETHQQAVTAIERAGVLLPSARNPHQQVLESEILVALVSVAGSPRGHLPKRRWWPREQPLMIESVCPAPDHLDIRVREDRLTEFCWAVFPRPHDAYPTLEAGVRGLRYRCLKSRVELYREGEQASIIIRARPAAWRAAVNEAREIQLPPGDNLGQLLNPRWARDDSDCRHPARALVASELLRRAALFTDGPAAEWIDTWQDGYLLGPHNVATWLEDPVPEEVARMLTHAELGVRIPKPAVFEPDIRTVHQFTHDPRFMSGPVYSDMIKTNRAGLG